MYQALQAGYKVQYMVSMLPKSNESYMFHHPNIELTKVQAKLMGFPIKTKETEGEKELELKDLYDVLKSLPKDIECVVTGAVASKYQKSRIDDIAFSLGFQTFSPLWNSDPYHIWRMLLDNQFKVMITAVACEGLGKEWLGEVINHENIKELTKLSEKYRFHIGGEGGEFETLVVNCPMFKNPLKINEKSIEWDDKTNSGFLKIVNVF